MDNLTDQNAGYSLRIDREQQSLTHKVCDALRKAIISGEFEPGQRLVERMLCDLTGVSRTAIREALRTLEAEGLVVNIPNHGPTVVTISRDQAEQIYTVRLVLEVKAVELFLQHMQDEDLALLERALRGMEKACADGDIMRVNDLKREFYDIIVTRCGNQIIEQMLKQIFAKIAILRHMTMVQINRTFDAISEMRAMYEALASRDEEAARTACIRHVNAAAAVALNALSRNQKS
ncbi:GntR family transcriptional regulator [Pseudochelatococcus sp. B33]